MRRTIALFAGAVLILGAHALAAAQIAIPPAQQSKTEGKGATDPKGQLHPISPGGSGQSAGESTASQRVKADCEKAGGKDCDKAAGTGQPRKRGETPIEYLKTDKAACEKAGGKDCDKEPTATAQPRKRGETPIDYMKRTEPTPQGSSQPGTR